MGGREEEVDDEGINILKVTYAVKVIISRKRCKRYITTYHW